MVRKRQCGAEQYGQQQCLIYLRCARRGLSGSHRCRAGGTGNDIRDTFRGGAKGNYGNIQIGSTYATAVTWSDTQVVATVPSTVSGQVKIAQNNTWSNGVAFSVLPAPTISSLSPSSGSAGTLVTIAGSNLGTTQGAVTFNGFPATPTSWSATSITVSVPTGATTGNVVVTASGVNTNALSFTVLPQITGVSNDPIAAGQDECVNGSGFGSSQGSSTVSVGGTILASNSWSDTRLCVTIPANFTPSTTSVQVTTSDGTSNAFGFAVSGQQQAPVLKLRIDDSPAQVTLSDSVNTDWIVWGADGSTPSATRKTNAGLISDLTFLSGATVEAGPFSYVQFNWTGGDLIASATAALPQIGVFETDAGFQITVPANTSVQTLKLFALIGGQGARLDASISDGGSTAITDTSVTSLDNAEKTYSIDFRAASAGQTLTVQLKLTDSNSYLGLHGAVLQPHLPEVSLTTPTEGDTYASGVSVPLSINANQYDSTISSVDIADNGASIFSLSSAPYSASWGGTTPGHHLVTAQATDNLQLSTTSNPVGIDVIGSGGSLSVSLGQPNGIVDLTSEGTAYWKLSGNIGSNFDSKRDVPSVISDVTQVGNHPTWATDACGSQSFSFSDGTPDLSRSGVNPCVYADGLSNGLQFTVAADTTLRVLRIYLDAEFAKLKLRAYLSDGSAAPVTDTSFDNPDPATSRYYAITYKAASTGQVLTVRLTIDQEYDWGSLSMYAATLDGATFTDAPIIASLSPTSAAVGDPVTISGTGFGSSQGTSTVQFNGVSAIPTNWSANQITVPVPSVATSGLVVVSVSSRGSIGEPFTVLPPPSITSLSSTFGAVGAMIVLTGTDFGPTQDTSAVTFNGVPATVTNWGANSISATVPAGATTGNIVVSTRGGTSNGVGFLVVAPPTITELSQTTGGGNITVTISGSDFGASQGSGYVTFAGVRADISDWNSASIVAFLPNQADPGPAQVTVFTSGVSSNSASFTILPKITIMSPGASPVGGTVNITGTNLGTSGTLTFNGVLANTSTWTPTNVIATVPTSATTGAVVATSNSESSDGFSFQVVPGASVSGISTASGIAGTNVTISGSNFGGSQATASGSVLIGGAEAPISTWTNSTIVAQVPSEAEPGLGSLAVTLAGVPSNSYAFTAIPSLSSGGSSSGGSGTFVAITGANFGSEQGASTIQFGSTSALVENWGSGTVMAQVPALPVGAVPVTVSAGGNTTNSIQFMVIPTVTTIAPASGNIGTEVTLNGGSFGTSGTVTFNGVQAPISTWTDSTVTVQVPSSASSGPIILSTNGISATGVPFLIVPPLRQSGDPISSLKITPTAFSMSAGETRDLTAVDDLGNPVTDVTWSSSDSSVASFVEETSALTANNLGEVTITASSGGQTAQATLTVYVGTALPSGTAIWSVAAVPGLGEQPVKLMATPTGTNKSDLFYITRDHNDTVAAVQGLTIDGKQLWSIAVPKTGNTYLSGWMPDRFGGIVYSRGDDSARTISRIDGDTGRLSWSYALGGSNYSSSPSAIGQDGTVYIIVTIQKPGSPPNYSTNYVSALDGKTGIPKFTVDLPHSYDRYVYNGSVILDGPQQAATGSLTVMPDGSVYLEAATYDDRKTASSRTISEKLDLIKINSDGTSTKQSLGSWFASGDPYVSADSAVPGEVIPDGHGQYLATWVQQSGTSSTYSLKANHAGNPYTIPISGSVPPSLVLGENDTAFALSGGLVAFNINTGTPLWTDPSPHLPAASLIAATSGGGVIVTNNNQLAQYDASGNKNSGPLVDSPVHAAGDAFLNGAYRVGQSPNISLDTTGMAVEFPKDCPWARPQADGSADPKVRVNLHVYQIDDPTNGTYGTNQISDEINTAADYWWEKAAIKLDWDSSITTLVGCDRNLHPFGCSEQEDLTEIHTLSQYAEIVDSNKMNTSKGLGLFFTSLTFGRPGDGPGDTLGITPWNFRSSGKYEPRIMFSHLAPWQVVAHELGHAFQLPHYTTTDALTNLNPADFFFGLDYLLVGVLKAKNNLMCGPDPSGTTVYCPNSPPNTDLTADQIVKAVKGAAERSQQ
jgi:hypothetical protein